MEFQNIFIYHCQDSLEIRLVTKCGLQSLKLGHSFSNLTICIDELVKDICVFIRELTISERPL